MKTTRTTTHPRGVFTSVREFVPQRKNRFPGLSTGWRGVYAALGCSTGIEPASTDGGRSDTTANVTLGEVAR